MRSEEAILFIVLIIVALGAIAVYVLFLLTLQNTMKLVKPANQKLSPGEVWMMFIPFFNLVWQFMMINRIGDSLKAEFADRNIQVGEDRPGVQIGITYAILNLCGIIPFLGWLASLGGLVCWIIYWVKIKSYKDMLMNSQPVTPY